MKLHQAASTDKTAMQDRSAATVQRLNKPADMMDNRVTASAQVQRQTLSDQSPQAMQLKKHLASLNQAVQRAADDELVQGKFATAQRAEDEEPMQGKFDTAQRVEEEELVQGRFDTAQCAEDEELLQGKFETAQRVEEEEPLQGKFETVQCAEEEEPIQSKFETAQRAEDDEPLQGKFTTVQRAEDEDLLQGKFDTAQRMSEEEPLQAKSADASPTQLAEQANPKLNNTGLPNQLKAGIELLSGMSMDHVKVHYNSAQPAQLNAHAYAQGSDIHVAPGQEQHLPHEAWHVVQQAQGRVKPTMQMKMGVLVNDDVGLETEADVMGAKALAQGAVQMSKEGYVGMFEQNSPQSQPMQQKKRNKSSSIDVIDVNVQRKAINPAKVGSSGVIQRYTYNADPAEITVKHPKGSHKWIESTGAHVTWDKGEIMDPDSIGSHKVNNHGWKGLLKNQSNGNNATGLHVVNGDWGGSANALDGNLVPGTPSLNGHHKSIENQVHNLFKNNGGKAPKNISYKADVWTPYDQTMDLTKNKSGDVLPYKDAIIECTVKAGSETLVDKVRVELGGGTKIVVP